MKPTLLGRNKVINEKQKAVHTDWISKTARYFEKTIDYCIDNLDYSVQMQM